MPVIAVTHIAAFSNLGQIRQDPEDDLERERIAEREAFEEQQEMLRRKELEETKEGEVEETE